MKLPRYSIGAGPPRLGKLAGESVVDLEEAAAPIAGYMVCNNVTARDWQFRSPTYTIARQSFLRKGDVVRVVITGLGAIENRFAP